MPAFTAMMSSLEYFAWASTWKEVLKSHLMRICLEMSSIAEFPALVGFLAMPCPTKNNNTTLLDCVAAVVAQKAK